MVQESGSVPRLCFQGFGFRVWVVAFGVLGFRVYVEFRVQGLG